MKIAIVTGHFMPEVGYQEVYLARAFRRLGNEVTVFSSPRVSPAKRRFVPRGYIAGVTRDEKYGYVVDRLPVLVGLGSMIVCRGLRKKVEAYNPELVLVIGVGKLFPVPVLREKRKFRLIVLFGDNSGSFNWGTFRSSINNIKNLISRKWIKSRYYMRALRAADRVVAYTPETPEILRKVVGQRFYKKFAAKIIMSTLGFDPDEFYFDESERRQGRTKLGFKDDETVLITVTRVTESKQIENVVKAVGEIIRSGVMMHYIIVGMDESAYARKFRTWVDGLLYAHRIHLLPFMHHNSVRLLCNTADIGIWTRAAISIQEAMGTGIQVILPKDKSVAHLIMNNRNGIYFSGDCLIQELKRAINRHEFINQESRKQTLRFNADFLSYDAVATQLLSSIFA